MSRPIQNSKFKIHNSSEAIVVAAVFLLVNLASFAFQKPITQGDGKGWDGVEYYKTADQIAKGQPIVGLISHTYRIGTPFLAVLISKDNLIQGFKIANLIANVFLVILLVVWLRLYVARWPIRAVLVALFILQWHGPVRFVHFYPVYADPWSIVCMLAGLICIHKLITKTAPELRMIAALCAISFAGVLFRETALIMPMSALLSRNLLYMRFKQILLYAAPLVFGLAAFGLTHLIAHQTQEFSFLNQSVNWAYSKPIPTYIHAWFIAYGPILVLPLFAWRDSIKFLAKYQFQLVFLLGVAAFAYVGGDDHERYIYYSMPVIYATVGVVLEGRVGTAFRWSPAFLAVLAVAQAISERVIWTTPDFPNPYPHPLFILAPVGDQFPYLDLMSMHGPREIEQVSLVQYLGLTAALLIWLAIIKKLQIVRLRRTTPRRERRLLAVGQGTVSLGVIALLGTSWFEGSADFFGPKTVLTLQQRWELKETVSEPRGIAYLDGKVYIAAYERQTPGKVFVLDTSTSQYNTLTPLSGNGLMPFAHPGDVKVGPGGLIYVLNNGDGGQEVLALKPDGQVVRQIPLNKTTHICMGLAFGPDNSLYVSDRVGGQVLKYGLEGGDPVAAYAGVNGILNNPSGLAVDDAGTIYTTETYQRVQQLNQDGTYLRQFDVKSKPQYMAMQGDWLDVTGDTNGMVSINMKTGRVQQSVFNGINAKPQNPTGITNGPGDTLFMLDVTNPLTVIQYKVQH